VECLTKVPRVFRTLVGDRTKGSNEGSFVSSFSPVRECFWRGDPRETGGLPRNLYSAKHDRQIKGGGQ